MCENVIDLLKRQKKTIATMESCTGGGLANEITNHEGASEVLRFSAVTYSNEYKIKMGVPKEIINMYTVYSMETAMDMSKHIAEFANANYGVGITGKLKRADKANIGGNDDKVFVSIYNRDKSEYSCFSMIVTKNKREENKSDIIKTIIEHLEDLLGEKYD